MSNIDDNLKINPEFESDLDQEVLIPEVNPLVDILRRMKSNRMVMTGFIVLVIIVLLTLFAPPIGKLNPEELHIRERFSPPSAKYIFGSDNYGRDIFSRVIYGARLSLRIGLSVAITTTLIGMLIGLVAGYIKKLDNVIMRLMDALMAFPVILLGIAITAALLPSEASVILALTIVYSPRTARIVRGSVLSVKQNYFVESAMAAGAKTRRIMFRHILPNCISPLIVQFSFIFAYAILAEAGLSYVGAGPPPPTPSWGNILSEGREFIIEAPWITVFPGLFIVVTVLGLNLLGDGMRDVLDPRLKL